jgi:predicted flap endonuclease-1-like 5' DNA nuclease
MYLNMNGYVVIGIFTLILAVTLFWLQGRQAKQDAPKPKKASEKKIEVIKARDWPLQGEKEPEQEKETEPEPVTEEPPAAPIMEKPVIEEADPEVETVIEEPAFEATESEPVEEVDITLLSGVGPKYRSLLREAGITTINQIAASEPEALLNLLNETNEKAEITKRPPTMYNVENWVAAAKAQLL